MNAPLHCSFCGKRDCDVEIIVAGPTVFICCECVDVCADVVREDRAKRSPGEIEYASWSMT